MWIVCALCGSLVADTPRHATWHDMPVAVVLGTQPPPPGADPDDSTDDETPEGAPDGD